ncbi:MAG: hypothetical protein HY784_00125, partial [Chloroflexi bacterium]|nr:hypothetical protein [Chloroflexota bacterium]
MAGPAETRPVGRPARPAGSPDSAVRDYGLLVRRYERTMEVSRNLASTLDLSV